MGFGSLAQTPDEPYPEEGAGMPETFQSPAGRAMANIGIGLAKAIWDIPRKLGQAAEVPAGLRREDVTDIPVRHGITGTNQFGSEPQDELVEGTTGSAINRIGTGLPFAPRGVGAFGGRLNAAVADAPPDYLYHGTGKSNRESILRNGLLRSKSDDGGIYLTSAPQSEIPSNKIDRWKVDVRGLKLEPDMTTEAAPGEKWFVHNEGDIPPSRLSLSGHESPYAGWHEAMEGIKAYHGSPHDVSELKAGNSGNYGPATYFHTAVEDAERYRPPGGKVYEAHLNLKKPFDMDKPVSAEDAAAILRAMGHDKLADSVAASGKGYRNGNELWYWGMGQGKSQAERAAALRSAGYDSLIGNPGREITGTSTRSPEIAVYDPKLIDILRKYGWAGFVGSAGLLGGKDSSKEM